MSALFGTPELDPCRVEAWPFQRDGIDAIFAALKVKRRVLCNVFTGGGKTILAALICRRGVENKRRILFLVPTIELAHQTASKMDMAGLTAMIEQAGQRARDLFEPHVVVGSLMTMKDIRRLESFGPDYFDLVVVDEAHMAMAESVKRVLAYFSRAKVIGLTATVKRSDEQCLGHIFDEVAFRYTLIDAWKAPHPGPYACDLVPVKCDLDIDLRKLKPQKGDFSDRDLDDRITPMIDMMANKIKEKIGERRTVVFLPSIRSAQLMAEGMAKAPPEGLGMRSEAVWGSDPDRAAKIARFRSGETQVLTNMNLLTTGFDVPETAAVVLVRPTRSHTLYLQMIGRGTRRNKVERDCLLIDFGWLTDEFPPVQAADLLSSPGFDAEAAEIARELIAKTPGLSLRDAIEQAEAETEERKLRRKQYAVRISIAEREVVCDEQTYSMKEAYADGGGAAGGAMPMAPRVERATEAQIARLRQWGYSDCEGWSKAKASHVIGSRIAQWKANKSHSWQRDKLVKVGVPIDEARDLSKEAAAEKIAGLWEGKQRQVYGGRNK